MDFINRDVLLMKNLLQQVYYEEQCNTTIHQLHKLKRGAKDTTGTAKIIYRK